ncbi:MAG: 50S ribosomal protein L3 [Candidatus Woesearchaeota archaeon]|nr:50S ribosomal protein L3 [Candidatus Woesearchaeota archaeon]
MATTRQPRSGSLQFWPRKRSVRTVPRIRTLVTGKDAKLTGFAGYKAGMTHVKVIETNKNSHLKGEELSIPVTIIECPPLKIASVRLYKKGSALAKEIHVAKEFTEKPNIDELNKVNAADYQDLRVNVFTQPSLTGFGRKNADVFEVAIGGKFEDKLKYVKENIGKDIPIESLIGDGELVDIKGITKGRGFRSALQRFGIGRRQHKSEKGIRTPGSLGPWCGQGHIMWRVAYAGKDGFHQRTEYNKQIVKIAKPEQVNPKSGLLHYGVLKNSVILVKGSVPGPCKRLVVMQKPLRAKKHPSLQTVEEIDVSEKQGR